MISIVNLEKKFGDLEALKNINLEIEPGKVTAIIGPNGSGKTTLIKSILGLVKPEGGKIFVNNNLVNGDYSYKKDIGYMPQVARYPENLKVIEVINMIKDLRNSNVEIDNDLLEAFNLKVELNKPFRTLSGGTRQKVSAIIALIHDVLVVLGIFAILGHFFGVEVDSLFVTALLTVIGFSVHDTIVVFDRIRENLRRSSGSFSQIVNDSILQTLDRSLNTSLTVLLVLFALLLFGGESIRWFVVALLIGVASGTYSSIFNAAPILVVWQEWSEKRKKITK